MEGKYKINCGVVGSFIILLLRGSKKYTRTWIENKPHQAMRNLNMIYKEYASKS